MGWGDIVSHQWREKKFRNSKLPNQGDSGYFRSRIEGGPAEGEEGENTLGEGSNNFDPKEYSDGNG